MTNIQKIDRFEYVYGMVDENRFEVTWHCFPHLTSKEDVLNAVSKYFKRDISKDVEDSFYGDAYLALTYTLTSELNKLQVLVTSEGVGANILEGMQDHIKKDLKLRGVFIKSCKFKPFKNKNKNMYLDLEHAGLIY